MYIRVYYNMYMAGLMCGHIYVMSAICVQAIEEAELKNKAMTREILSCYMHESNHRGVSLQQHHVIGNIDSEQISEDDVTRHLLYEGRRKVRT